jgi:hypothetical protein
MVIKRLFRSTLHEHSDPAQRVLGVAELPPDSAELAGLLTSDSAPEVRAAAARRCANLDALAAALQAESDASVRSVLTVVLGPLLADTQDNEAAATLLQADACNDAIRREVARRSQDADRRRIAIAALRDESSLVELALAAEHAETRMAAAERVHTPGGLARLADGARDKDRGVARLTRKRLDAMTDQASQAAAADEILAQLELLANTPGPILTAVIELDRRWDALDLDHDAERMARSQAARQVLLTRFDREREEQQARGRFERRLSALLATSATPVSSEALAGLREELAGLREEATTVGDDATSAKLTELQRRFDAWEQELRAQADAEALVVEAEQLAEGTSIDNAGLPERWQALSRAIRTPALTRRFEAAMVQVEQRRLAQVTAADQEANAARQDIHRLLHVAEQALTAGHVQAARAAADEIRTRKAAAGTLPKPTTQRLSRVVQQLTELERWESFGQQSARVQLCERAEALATTPIDAPRLAAEVQKLRAEWKALDEQHAGVPKALWERFDRACEKAYAPAARHFAELAAQRKDARKRRDAFIGEASAQVAARLQEPRDWRAIEHWLRDTDRTWRDGDLGSVDKKAWSTFDTRYRAAVAPLRDALAAARLEAKAGRQALIDEANAVAAKAMERDAPSKVKALQAQWQVQAKAFTLPQRDERVLWEQFRAACNAVFDAREAKRKHEDVAKHESHRALEAICLELEQLAAATDKDESEMRRRLRDLDDEWRKRGGGSDPAARRIESRFRDAKAAAAAALSARGRLREASVWQTLAAKERLCEELDAMVVAHAGPVADAAATTIPERWAALPPLSPAWEKPMLARRDAALRALAEQDAAVAHVSRVEQGNRARAEVLLELEIALGLDSPQELQAQRLALQVKQLRQRFQSAGSGGTARERLVAWCAEPGVADARERQRSEKVFAAIARAH